MSSVAGFLKAVTKHTAHWDFEGNLRPWFRGQADAGDPGVDDVHNLLTETNRPGVVHLDAQALSRGDLDERGGELRGVAQLGLRGDIDHPAGLVEQQPVPQTPGSEVGDTARVEALEERHGIRAGDDVLRAGAGDRRRSLQPAARRFE